MKITCITKDITKLSDKSLNMGYGISDYTLSGLEVGTQYDVYGMGLWEEGHLLYLIDASNNNEPLWYPYEIFEISDNTLSNAWHINNLVDDSITFIWGYKELVEDSFHAGLIMDRDSEAIKIFQKRKEELKGTY